MFNISLIQMDTKLELKTVESSSCPFITETWNTKQKVFNSLNLASKEIDLCLIFKVAFFYSSPDFLKGIAIFFHFGRWLHFD